MLFMNPSIVVIASCSLGRAFAAFMAHMRADSVVVLDPESRRAEFMGERLFCLDYGSEFSVHQKIKTECLRDWMDESRWEMVSWVFSFSEAEFHFETQRLKRGFAHRTGLHWIEVGSLPFDGSCDLSSRLTLSWAVSERFVGRLRVKPKKAAFDFEGSSTIRFQLEKLFQEQAVLEEAPQPVDRKAAWKAWASRF